MIITRQLRVYGIVQGVGFRPTVSRHAMTTGIHGSVCNRGPYVEIYVQGTPEQVEYFEHLLRTKPPKRAAILKIGSKQVENPPLFDDFQIVESKKTSGEIFISPDIAICDDCKEEMYNQNDRRFRHPFINCTCCGPRLTILDALPYDRERTSMKEFPMCPDCAEEYYSPETRRYDAQPVCCNDCGPRVYLLPEGEITETSVSNQRLDLALPDTSADSGPEKNTQASAADGNQPIIQNLEAISHARRIIKDGGIVAIKGIGGFHLCCDATNEDAVRLLRTRKTRPMKPLAVMMKDMDTVRRECSYLPEQEEILTGHQKPILLLRKKDGGKLAPSIAPGNPKVGVMLAYAPVQMLLFDLPSTDGTTNGEDGIDMPDCLVMTSGNVSGAPICRDDRDAATELGYLCDAILSHNRLIRLRADDTVMDFYRGRPYMIRRSRGYAPLPILSEKEMKGAVLAVGGELKNTFCIAVNGLFYQSPYIGDLADLRTVLALKESIERFQTLLEVKPSHVVCDLHPKYNSTLVAEELDLPVTKIQHHYAHILSCMAENDHLDPVIGLSLDGTGYGDDGTIWGGEVFLADVHGYERAGHIKPFLQIGGDMSSKEGWRIAVSMIYSLTGKDKEKTTELVEKLGLCSKPELKMQMVMADRRINAVTSTSAGRLFDAVSAILGVRRSSTFEGEASTALQFVAEEWMEKHTKQIEGKTEAPAVEKTEAPALDTCPGTGHLPRPWTLAPTPMELATDRLVDRIVEAKLAGEESGYLAWMFHDQLAEMLYQACLKLRETSGRNSVALSGGCFQNTLLLEMTQRRLERAGFEVLIHNLIPPNDGGIALGQALYGMMNCVNETQEE